MKRRLALLAVLPLGAAVALAAGLLSPPPAAAGDALNELTCETLVAVPESLQVAWVSPARKRVGAGTDIQVVRVGDLRSWVRQNNADQLRVLQAMGYAGPDGGRKAEKAWKVTIFDVKTEQLCRPVTGATPGEDLSGAPACDEQRARPVSAWESECGYTLDRGEEAARGLDTFRITWEQASSQGFCVFPLERFIEGA